jgi:hypothetical protein
MFVFEGHRFVPRLDGRLHLPQDWPPQDTAGGAILLNQEIEMRNAPFLALVAVLGSLLLFASNASAQQTGSTPVPQAPQALDVPAGPPSAEQQARLLDEVRHYALNYTQRLPDFICLEQTHRYIDDTGQAAWRPVDVITARLSYFNQKEDYKLVTPDGRVDPNASYASVAGVFSMGDFGTTMRDIFDPASQTRFAWEKWTTLRGRLTQIFSYRVPLRLYTIAYQGAHKGDVGRIKVAYRGSVLVDKELNAIVRITHEALNIPPSFPIRDAKETMDYDFVKIGESEFLLPLVATLQVRTQMYSGKVWTRNVKEFRLYRKFSADAVIKFAGPDLTPLPDNQIKQQPPQHHPQ